MAWTGCTRTARHTGQATAANGSRKPIAAAWANVPAWKGVCHTGSGSMLVNTFRSGIPTP